MLELGSGIAIAGLCVSGGAVAITAIRTFYSPRKQAEVRKSDFATRQGFFPCQEHSGIVACLGNIEKTQARQEEWLKEIRNDLKGLRTESLGR
jgi:hypothetical protein